MDITVQELHEKYADGEKVLLIDVREPHEYEAFNLGGRLIPLGVLPARMWELDAHKNDEIVVHCRSGARSGMAKGLMEAQGFTNVRNLLGGVEAWKDLYGTAKPQ